MKKIHKLSPHLIAKIAAGEVIERPAFAVKELIENAIDAGATDISIIIENAGLKKIHIIDNGEGMSKEDLEECWKPHTTSKIKERDSLQSIQTFGFRGEALASLAAVSHLTIQSRTKEESIGNLIEIKNGKLVKTHPIGMPIGTIIIAENLFVDIPARKKFLKSPQTEFRHITEMVSYFLISYPAIHFLLKHNSRIVLNVNRQTNLSDRIEEIVGSETFSFFMPINKTNGYVSLSGFIAKPQINTTIQSKQLLFVNKRKVHDRLISLAVKEAYGTMLESNTYPLFILFLDIPLEIVDINVHPRKEQVAFLNNSFIMQTVKELVSEILNENNITFQNLSWKRFGVGTTKSFAATVLREKVLDKNTFSNEKDFSPIQINKLYILFSTNNEIIIFDQHAAHERILFEKLKKEFIKQKKKNKTFLLKSPLVLNLSKNEYLLLEEYQKLFKKLGFIINKVKDHKLVVTHIPHIFQDRNPQELIKQILDDIDQGAGIKEIDGISEEMIAFLACRSAVKAGDNLTEEHMKKIIEELEKTPNNATCPHGRPTRVAFPITQLNHMFKR